MDTDSFIVYIKAEDIYKNIIKDVETTFNTSNNELERALPIGKGLMRNELGGKVMTEFATLRRKTYNYLTVGDEQNKKNVKGTKTLS